MSYREVPAWLSEADTEPTVLLDDEELTPESVSASGGTWTAATDAGAVEVRLAWTDRVFTHASAVVGDDRLALDRSSAEDGPSGDDADPVFAPEEDRRDFEVRLVADGSGGDDHPESDADSGGPDT